MAFHRDPQTYGATVTVAGAFVAQANGWVRATYVATAGQISFVLPSVASDPNTYKLTVNGIDYDRTTHYTVSGTTLTWLNLFPLVVGDRVAVTYQL